MNLMEAESVAQLPRGAQWQYEPKWDGFRCLLIREGERVRMQSKGGRDLVRYFPEVASAASALSLGSFILDGELIIQLDEGYSLDSLLQRIHPAASARKASCQRNAGELHCLRSLTIGRHGSHGTSARRATGLVENFAQRHFKGSDVFLLSPASRNYADAKKWLETVNEDHDGVVAKRLDLPYRSGARDGMQKVKLLRSADCVIGGFRYGEKKQANRKIVGSLLLGFYDEFGLLHHVGFTSAIKSSDRLGLTEKLEKIASRNSFTGKAPGAPSRWSTKRSADGGGASGLCR